MTITTKTLYIALIQYSYEREPNITFVDRDMTDYYAKDAGVTLYKVLEAREIEVPAMPSKAEINGLEIEGLEKNKSEIQRQARSKVKAIEERIANLRCIDHMEAEA